MIERYQIIAPLGEGGSGSVYKAWDQKLQRHVAIKRLLPAAEREFAHDAGTLAREAAALSALQHPNIVAVYDLDTDGDEPFVVMEFINGETMEATLRRGALMEPDFLHLAEDALEGLSAAHQQGMCHRDLKPSNLMAHWLPNGQWQIKLLDFGLANQGMRPAQQALAGEGVVAGSVHFMAPEQFLHQPLDARTDLYSFGCVLYYALTGAYPFQGATAEEVMNAHLSRRVTPLHTLRSDLPRLLMDWVMWLMSRQPEERPDSAAEALRVLRGITSGELTAIPVGRSLKTREIASLATAPVPAAPLHPDRQMRATARQAPPAAAAASPPVVPPAPASPPPASGRKALAAGLVLVAAAGGAAAWYFLAGPGSGRQSSPPASSPSRPALSDPAAAPQPPDKGLVIWLDGAEGTRRDRGAVAANFGDAIDQWDDRARLAGNNPAQYHKTQSRPEERLRRLPVWTSLTNADGLAGTHGVVAFGGDDCLVLARDRNNVGAPVAAEFKANAFTVMALFKAAAKPDAQSLLWSVDESGDAQWDLAVREGKLRGRIWNEGKEFHPSLAIDPARGFHLATLTWDGTAGEARLHLTSSDGATVDSTPARGQATPLPPGEIRIGAAKPRAGSIRDFLDGAVGAVLVYNRVLTDAERRSAIDALSRRWFGRPAR